MYVLLLEMHVFVYVPVVYDPVSVVEVLPVPVTIEVVPVEVDVVPTEVDEVLVEVDEDDDVVVALPPRS